jgi:hypothetical protein
LPSLRLIIFVRLLPIFWKFISKAHRVAMIGANFRRRRRLMRRAGIVILSK